MTLPKKKNKHCERRGKGQIYFVLNEHSSVNISGFLGEGLWEAIVFPKPNMGIACGDHFGYDSHFCSEQVVGVFHQDIIPETSFPHAFIFSDIGVIQQGPKVSEKVHSH